MVETPVIVQIMADDILEIALERSGLNHAPCVPYEATAGLAMIMLRDHGIVSVHFAGLPPGTAALMIKFLKPETLERFGGAKKLAHSINSSLDTLANVLKTKGNLKHLLLSDIE